MNGTKKGLLRAAELILGGLCLLAAFFLLLYAVVMDQWSPRAVTVLWAIAGTAAVCWTGGVLLYRHNRRRHKRTLAWVLVEETRHYRFLLSQLVARDFNHKYRQSMLGVLWSFINPLLTMLVQFLVFNTLFQVYIEHFLAYLMTGIVFFNFFNEASTLAMDSITANTALITKVYMPRYIYPISRVLFALLNVAITMIPMFAMILLTGVPVTKAALLLPIPVLGIACFSLGVGMVLATMNVFFRDTAFLWGVVLLLWQYLTPLFYPESIIPASWIHIYHLNPMYQFIYFIRCLLLDGVTPPPQTYLYCALCALLPLVLGFWVFRRKQNDFIYYL